MSVSATVQPATRQAWAAEASGRVFHSSVSPVPPSWSLFLISSLICLILLPLEGHTLPLPFQMRTPIIPFTMMKGSLVGACHKLKWISAMRILCR